MDYGKLMCVVLTFMLVCASGFMSAQAAEQEPGAMVYKLGDAQIIAVRDAVSERGKELLIGDSKRIDVLMPEKKSLGGSNIYIVKMENSTILIDTGWGQPRGESLDNLKSLGITPEQINVILFTHLHGDHVSGLLREGKIVFPNAQICVSQAEIDYWFNDEEMNKSANKGSFELVRRNISAYGDMVRTFAPGEAIMPGIIVINEYGHTPGHVGYLVESEGKKLLIWGDLTHFTEVQLAAPEISVTYDVDPKKAAATRQAILNWVTNEKIFIAGMHITYPGIGKIRAISGNSYIFEPLNNF